MSKTYSQYKHTYLEDQGSSNDLTAFDTNPTSGRSILVVIHGYHAGGYDVTSVTDTKSNTYTRVVASALDQSSSRRRVLIYAAHNITGGSSFTITVTHSNATLNTFFATAIEFSATGTVSTDQSGSDTEAYGDDSITATCGGANADAAAFVVGVAGWANNSTEIVGTLPGSPWVTLVAYNSTVDYELNGCVSYKIVTGTETSAYTVSVDDTDVVLVAAIASFKETGSTSKYLKLLTSSSAAGVSSVAGTVFNAPSGGDITGSKIGEFTGASFLGANSLDGGKAKLLVNVTEFGGTALTTANTPHVYVRTNSFDTGIVPATVIEV